MKKIILAILVVLLCLGVVGNVYAKDSFQESVVQTIDKSKVEEFLKDFFYAYYSAWEYLQVHDELNSFIETNENTLFMLKEMEYWIEYCKVFTSCQFRNLEIEAISLKDYTVKNNNCQMVVYVKYSYIINTVERYKSSCGELFEMELITMNDNYKIISFDSDAEQYSYHKELLMGSTNKGTVDSMTIVDEGFESAVQQIEEKKEIYDEWIASWQNREIIEERVYEPYFNTTKTIAYAQTYGAVTQNEIFKRMDSSIGENYNDCTNFISQCIWIGLGGAQNYSITEDKQALRDLVWADYKMFPRWYGACYGRPGLPTGAWMRVVELWNLVTTCTVDEGPVGVGYNNNGAYATCPEVYHGNVVQFKGPTDSRYSHSAMVVAKSSTEVYVAQHDSDYNSRPLSALVEYFGGNNCYMRLIKFAS